MRLKVLFCCVYKLLFELKQNRKDCFRCLKSQIGEESFITIKNAFVHRKIISFQLNSFIVGKSFPLLFFFSSPHHNEAKWGRKKK